MLATVALGAAHWPLGARAGAPPACRVPCAPQRRPLCGSCMRRHRAAAAQAGQSTSGSVDAGVRIKLACGAARGTAARGNTAQRAVREVAGSRRLLCLQRAAGLSEHLIDLPAAGWDRAARAAQAWRWAPSSATCWRRRSRCSAASLRGDTSPRRPSRMWAAACSWCLPWPPRLATSEQAGWLCHLWVTALVNLLPGCQSLVLYGLREERLQLCQLVHCQELQLAGCLMATQSRCTCCKISSRALSTELSALICGTPDPSPMVK